jgi:hypothetical protein
VQKGGGIKQLTACRTAAAQSPPTAASRLLGFLDGAHWGWKARGRRTGATPAAGIIRRVPAGAVRRSRVVLDAQPQVGLYGIVDGDAGKRRWSGIRWVGHSAGERRPASGGDVVVAQGGVGGAASPGSREGWRKGIEEAASVLVWVLSFFSFYT